MKGIKKYIGIAISAILLLSFSVTILPLDAFHDHSSAQATCSSKSGEACNHKVHVSNKGKFCWICAIHFDKTFTSSSIQQEVVFLPVLSLFTDNELTAHFLELPFSALRGPPGE